MSSKSSDLRSEYSPTLIKSGVRGKYAKRVQEEGTNQILIDPELHKLFPDSKSVNRALREYAESHRKSAT